MDIGLDANQLATEFMRFQFEGAKINLRRSDFASAGMARTHRQNAKSSDQNAKNKVHALIGRRQIVTLKLSDT
jgi:hypothetical protein